MQTSWQLLQPPSVMLCCCHGSIPLSGHQWGKLTEGLARALDSCVVYLCSQNKKMKAHKHTVVSSYCRSRQNLCVQLLPANQAPSKNLRKFDMITDQGCTSICLLETMVHLTGKRSTVTYKNCERTLFPLSAVHVFHSKTSGQLHVQFANTRSCHNLLWMKTRRLSDSVVLLYHHHALRKNIILKVWMNLYPNEFG